LDGFDLTKRLLLFSSGTAIPSVPFALNPAIRDIRIRNRELLRDPYWALKAEQHLEAEPAWPLQYGYAVKRRAK
jgi:hypothetical protein